MNRNQSYLTSFVKRLGRITPSQKKALQDLEFYSLDSENTLFELSQSYEKTILEIGFGNGEITTYLASKNPNSLIVASDVYLSGIGSLLKRISENSFKNIKIFENDVRELLLKISNNIFDEIYIICPDPWPKARHHKRRLIKNDFLLLLAKVLKKDGILYISTDWEDYAESIEDEIKKTNKSFEFKKIDHKSMPVTRFQQRAINEGRSIHTFLLNVLKK